MHFWAYPLILFYWLGGYHQFILLQRVANHNNQTLNVYHFLLQRCYTWFSTKNQALPYTPPPTPRTFLICKKITPHPKFALRPHLLYRDLIRRMGVTICMKLYIIRIPHHLALLQHRFDDHRYQWNDHRSKIYLPGGSPKSDILRHFCTIYDTVFDCSCHILPIGLMKNDRNLLRKTLE